MFAGLAIVLGAGPTGRVHHGETWQDGKAFRNGFKGFGNSVLLAILAIGGNPRKSSRIPSKTVANPPLKTTPLQDSSLARPKIPATPFRMLRF